MLKNSDPWFLALHDEQQTKIPKLISELLEKEGVAFDINGYRDAPPGTSMDRCDRRIEISFVCCLGWTGHTTTSNLILIN